MDYEIYYHNDARAALKRLSPDVARRIANKIERMRHDLAGDVKRLKAFSVGDWRVLFDVDGTRIIIHAVRHRSQAYDE